LIRTGIDVHRLLTDASGPACLHLLSCFSCCALAFPSPSSRLPGAVHRLFTDAHDPLPASADLLGFSFAWELDYSNILR
jgi:hypothetical protein